MKTYATLLIGSKKMIITKHIAYYMITLFHYEDLYKSMFIKGLKDELIDIGFKNTIEACQSNFKRINMDKISNVMTLNHLRKESFFHFLNQFEDLICDEPMDSVIQLDLSNYVTSEKELYELFHDDDANIFISLIINKR